MALQYFENHPEPDKPYWSILVNQDRDQTPTMFKKMATTNNMGDNSYGYVVYNKAGDVIAFQMLDEPTIKAPEIPKDPKKGMKVNIKVPSQFGIFPPYKVLKSILKDQNK